MKDNSDRQYKPLFPYFGGKSRIAHEVWKKLGDVPNYVEPFFGSGAVLFMRPGQPEIETVNDLDGMLANFWRAVQKDPQEVAHWADWPVNENDLHARHIWLVNRKESLQTRLEGDPEYCDPKIAGWWVWGQCAWIGGGWCSGEGPWQSVDGEIRNKQDGFGVRRQLPHLGDAGQGVHRQLPHLGDAGRGVQRQRPHLGDAGRGVQRQLPHLGPSMGVHRKTGGTEDAIAWFAGRLRRVRVCCGDWARVTTPSVTTVHGLTGLFLDPPYADTAGRASGIYAVDCTQVAHLVRDWCIANGDNPLLRIALCGYEGEHEMPPTWECLHWKATGGMGGKSGNKSYANSHKERIWFSPACIKDNRNVQAELF